MFRFKDTTGKQLLEQNIRDAVAFKNSIAGSLSELEKFVFLFALATRQFSLSVCWSPGYFAEYLGEDVEAVRAAMARLVQLGLVVCVAANPEDEDDNECYVRLPDMRVPGGIMPEDVHGLDQQAYRHFLNGRDATALFESPHTLTAELRLVWLAACFLRNEDMAAVEMKAVCRYTGLTYETVGNAVLALQKMGLIQIHLTNDTVLVSCRVPRPCKK